MKDIISGVLFDFCGFLTTRDKSITFSSHHNAAPAVEAIEKFMKKRNVELVTPNFDWYKEKACQTK